MKNDDYSNEIYKYDEDEIMSAVEYVKHNLPDKFILCNVCHNLCLLSDTEGEYPYQCVVCDEDLYEFETHICDINQFTMKQSNILVLSVLQTGMFNKRKE